MRRQPDNYLDDDQGGDMTDQRVLDTERDRPTPPPSHHAFGDDGWSSEPDVDPVREPTGWRARQWIGAGVAATVIAVGGVFGVSALASHTKSTAATTGAAGAPGGGAGFPGGAARGGLFGTVSSINGTSLVVSTVSGTTEAVATTSSTVFTKTVAGSLTDVRAGDHVVVLATGTTGLTAVSVIDSGTNTTSAIGTGAPPRGGQGAPVGGTAPTLVSGTVSTVGSGRLAITEASGTTMTVLTSSSTTVANVQTIGLSDLSVGEQVQVRGSTVSGTVTAIAIEAGGGFGPGAQGALPGQGAPGGTPGQGSPPSA
jgi:hypothetical protein